MEYFFDRKEEKKKDKIEEPFQLIEESQIQHNFELIQSIEESQFEQKNDEIQPIEENKQIEPIEEIKQNDEIQPIEESQIKEDIKPKTFGKILYIQYIGKLCGKSKLFKNVTHLKKKIDIIFNVVKDKNDVSKALENDILTTYFIDIGNDMKLIKYIPQNKFSHVHFINLKMINNNTKPSNLKKKCFETIYKNILDETGDINSNMIKLGKYELELNGNASEDYISSLINYLKQKGFKNIEIVNPPFRGNIKVLTIPI